jgi:hypothetical protein
LLFYVPDWWKKPFVEECFTDFDHRGIIHRQDGDRGPADGRPSDQERSLPPKMTPPLVPTRLE